MRQKRIITLILAVMMIITSLPLQVYAETNDKKINYDENPISDSGFKEGYINNKNIDVKIAKPENGTKEFIKGPDIPDIYTLKVEYKIQRGDRQINNYQPYEASVGEKIKEEDKKKIKQTINLPEFDGYTAPTPTTEYEVTHEGIIKKAKEAKSKDVVKKEGPKTWTEHKGVWPYVYTGTRNTLTVKHIFQSLEDRNEYGPMEGQTKAIETTETGITGSIVTISPLEKEKIKGFEPERSVIETQMPENTKEYVVEYRYNRKHFNVNYDTKDGSPIATRTIYYGQRIPTIPLVDEKGDITKDQNADPTYKLGSTFKGWKPSINLTAKDGTIYEKGETIKDKSGNPSKTLDLDLIMPAENITFTAEWKDKEKADYAVQYWAEKADHAEGASLLEKYDYMGAKVYRDENTGKRPDLDNQPIDGIVFPDLDQARLAKIWNGDKFERGQHLFLNKFYVYNKKLTAEENKDKDQPNMVKFVSSTGKTVYNIYYDRQIYDLYFTKSNKLSDAETFYPEIYKPNGKPGGTKVGGPGNLYHYQARFNQLMLGWPNDSMQTKGFKPGWQSYGWGPNYSVPTWPTHLDTPPYRLNADEFLDMHYNDVTYESRGGYTKKIDKGDGTYFNLEPDDFTTLSFGIKQGKNSIPHHMDFWMDGFKNDETIIRYDLYRSKADTKDPNYEHKAPKVQGFKAKYATQKTTLLDEDNIFEKNDKRDEITPMPKMKYKDIFGFDHTVGDIVFMQAFFNNADSYGDPKEGEPFKKNGYLCFKYTRDKFSLRFNYDPSKTKGDDEFDRTNQLETYYEFPLKVLSPDLVPDNTPRDEREYFKENPANFLDNPKNLQELGLTDLVFTDTDGKLKVKRPDNLPDQMVFKGWALDPAGKKLVWENKDEKMPNHAVNLYAKWGEPDYKWKVTIDPNGGSLYKIKPEELTKKTKTIQEGDIGNEEKKTYPEKLENEGKKQIFTVIQRQQLNEPKYHPIRPGYDFLGWEWVRFDKNGKEDKSYYNEYKVPELYSFGNDVVSDVYLRAIWVKNDLQTVMAYHHILDKDLNEIKESPEPQELPKRRIGYTAAALGSRQGAEYTLVPKAQWEDLKQKNETFRDYYDESTGRTNNYFQVHRIEGPNKGKQSDDFHFFYMPYRKREYKVNYLDERCKSNVEKFIAEAKDKFQKEYKTIKDSNITEDQKRRAYRNLIKTNDEYLESIVSQYSIIDAETVINGKRHYDARNYRHIPGWTLADNESAQQQLFFDVDESTNEFLGINGTGLGQIFFFYQDARAIEVKNPDDDVPEGYVRVTFKADEGGSFGKDDKGNDIKALYYDVIKGLKWDSLPVPQEWDGLENLKDKDKNYITPDSGKKFEKWDNKPLLNKGTVLQSAPKDYYVFTAYFDWSGLTSSGLVRTEAYKDPNGKWTNDFAPTIKDLKKQLVWKERDQVKPIPEGTKIQFFDENNKELTTNDQVYGLLNEKKAADKDELVRTVNIKAKVKFKNGKDPQELDIPITVYKNRYEALTGTSKPLFLSQAENKDAKDGGLKDILANTKHKRYIKVTVNPTEKIENKDAKVYYVNPNAWVDIPELTWTAEEKDKYSFLKWTADKDNQNEYSKKDGIFDFSKRHKFTEDTVITPILSKDVVEQEGKDKPDVPKTYVKVIVRTTDKATDETKFEKTFWVNPTKEVTIDVKKPEGKKNQEVDLTDANGDSLGKQKVDYVFVEWQKVKTGIDDANLTDVNPKETIDLAKNKYTDKVTIIEAAYEEEINSTQLIDKSTISKLDTPKGKEITPEDLKAKITPPAGKQIDSITVVSVPSKDKVGESKAKVVIKYTDGSTEGSNTNPVVIPVEVHDNIIPAGPNGEKPEKALKNYVKVTFKAGTGGKFENTLTGEFVYYVSPEVEVDLTDTANEIKKIPNVGYISGDWDTSETKKLKDIFKADETIFTFKFTKTKNIVEKTDENTEKPNGYVTVTFKTDGNGKIDGKDEKIYYVDPNAGVKLGNTANEATIAVPTPTANTNFKFTGKWQEDIDKTNPITSDRTHVAIFEAVVNKVTLTYEAGEGSGTVPEAVSVEKGKKVALANADGLSKDNATFAGWKIDGTTYKVGDVITLNESKTATAQWTTDAHKVEFDTDGGEPVPPTQNVVHNEKAKKPNTDPKKDGFVFAGWKEQGKVSQQDPYFDFATAITEDKTLVAQWTDAVQKIGENDLVDVEKFIKVTFLKGDHGTLKTDEQANVEKVTYKVAKDINFDQAVKAGLKVPEIVPAKYYKAKDANSGWDKALDLTLAAGETEKVFTAQYELVANVIPVDKNKDNETLKEEKPKDMVLVTFTVPSDKAYMLGDTKFYVKKNEVVNIEPPLVRRLELANGERNDYVFKGWDLTQLNNEWKFSADTDIFDKAKEKPTITIILPSAGDPEVSVESMTEGATAYLEVIRRGQQPVIIEAVKDDDYGVYYFEIPDTLGGALKKRDRIKVYAELSGIRSDTREYRIK